MHATINKHFVYGNSIKKDTTNGKKGTRRFEV